jgi:rod shape-determining protein MreD
MRILSIILLLFIVNAIQGVLGTYLISSIFIVDLTLIAVVFLSIQYRETGGTVIGFFFGLFQDGFSGGMFGMNAFSKTLVGFVVGRTARRLVLESSITHFLIIFTANLIEGVIAFLLVNIFEIAPEFRLSVNLLPSAFLNGILGVVIFRLSHLFRGRSQEDDYMYLESYR